jgi:hypothetical protein
LGPLRSKNIKLAELTVISVDSLNIYPNARFKAAGDVVKSDLFDVSLMGDIPSQVIRCRDACERMPLIFKRMSKNAPNITPLTNRYFQEVYAYYEVRLKTRTVLLIFYHRFGVAEGQFLTVNLNKSTAEISLYGKMDSCQIGRITFIIIPLTCLHLGFSVTRCIASSWVIQSKHNALANSLTENFEFSEQDEAI